MTKDPVTLAANDPLRAAVELGIQKRIHHLLVVDAQIRLIGIITDRDIKRALPSPSVHVSHEDRDRLLDETPVSRVMTREPFAVAPETLLAEAIRTMLAQSFSGLPVVKDDAIVGIFTQKDALRAYLRHLDSRG
jgi:acetoin utilization protein AcuB